MQKQIIFWLTAMAVLATFVVLHFRSLNGGDNQLIRERTVQTELGLRVERITAETLTAIPDRDLEQTIINFICDHISAEGYDRQYATVTSLPKGLQHIYTTWCLEGEVNNGGFAQYFFNDDGVFADEAIEGCMAIGAVKHAELLRQALAVHEKGRRKEGLYDALDQAFYALGQMSPFRIQYIRTHIEECVCD